MAKVHITLCLFFTLHRLMQVKCICYANDSIYIHNVVFFGSDSNVMVFFAQKYVGLLVISQV